MIELSRETTGYRINKVLNHPDVRPFVAPGTDTIDLSDKAENPRNYLLMGDHGGCMFFSVVPGVYEAHTQVLPEGRGTWTNQLLTAAAHWMFTRTDCFEIATRVPEQHVAAAKVALRAGMRPEFVRDDQCQFMGQDQSAYILSYRIQDWVQAAPEIVERGRWLHGRFAQEAVRLGIKQQPHGDDENHNRYAGSALEMAMAGQAGKAVNWYNRWAILARHATVGLVSTSPVVIKFDIGLLRVAHGDIEVIPE
jgi:hypothetical protein